VTADSGGVPIGRPHPFSHSSGMLMMLLLLLLLLLLLAILHCSTAACGCWLKCVCLTLPPGAALSRRVAQRPSALDVIAVWGNRAPLIQKWVE
jgi:hypothetical protein